MTPILLALVLASAASAEPCSTNAVDAARALYAAAPDLIDRDDTSTGLMSPALVKLLVRDAACAGEEVCALSADPWTGAQDGEIVEKYSFQQTPEDGAVAAVEFCYGFSLEPAVVDRKCSTLIAVRVEPGCWVIDDVRSPDGVSLKTTLEEYDYTP